MLITLSRLLLPCYDSRYLFRTLLATWPDYRLILTIIICCPLSLVILLERSNSSNASIDNEIFECMNLASSSWNTRFITAYILPFQRRTWVTCCLSITYLFIIEPLTLNLLYYFRMHHWYCLLLSEPLLLGSWGSTDLCMYPIIRQALHLLTQGPKCIEGKLIIGIELARFRHVELLPQSINIFIRFIRDYWTFLAHVIFIQLLQIIISL